MTKTIEERAKEYAEARCINVESELHKRLLIDAFGSSYIKGATDQKKVDIDKAKTAFGKACGWLSTYPWYNEVFEEFIKNIEE